MRLPFFARGFSHSRVNVPTFKRPSTFEHHSYISIENRTEPNRTKLIYVRAFMCTFRRKPFNGRKYRLFNAKQWTQIITLTKFAFFHSVGTFWAATNFRAELERWTEKTNGNDTKWHQKQKHKNMTKLIEQGKIAKSMKKCSVTTNWLLSNSTTLLSNFFSLAMLAEWRCAHWNNHTQPPSSIIHSRALHHWTLESNKLKISHY